MTDYNDGRWHGWNGGECPVDPCSEVEWLWMDPNLNTTGKSNGIASRAAWRNQVLRFRVTKPAPPKPREWWISPEGMGFLPHDGAEMPARWVRVREVLPE